MKKHAWVILLNSRASLKTIQRNHANAHFFPASITYPSNPSIILIQRNLRHKVESDQPEFTMSLMLIASHSSVVISKSYPESGFLDP